MDLGKDALNGFGEGPIHGAAGSELVATAAEMLGDGGDVDGALGAQADADAVLGEFTKKSGGFDTGDA